MGPSAANHCQRNTAIMQHAPVYVTANHVFIKYTVVATVLFLSHARSLHCELLRRKVVDLHYNRSVGMSLPCIVQKLQ